MNPLVRENHIWNIMQYGKPPNGGGVPGVDRAGGLAEEQSIGTEPLNKAQQELSPSKVWESLQVGESKHEAKDKRYNEFAAASALRKIPRWLHTLLILIALVCLAIHTLLKL